MSDVLMSDYGSWRQEQPIKPPRVKWCATHALHPDLQALIDALSNFWQAQLGNMCGQCHNGRLTYVEKPDGWNEYKWLVGNQRPASYHGCCNECPNLTVDGCIAKPLGCALFSCSQVHVRLESVGHPFNFYSPAGTACVGAWDLIWWLQGHHVSTSDYFDHGYKRMAQVDWRPDQLKALRIARHYVEAVSKLWVSRPKGPRQGLGLTTIQAYR